MPTPKQIQANRRNALQSTGPKTAEGKAVVKLNAVRHGLLSQEILLPDEAPQVLDDLLDGLRAEFEPVGYMENLLVDRIATLCWRLKRLHTIETGLFTCHHYGILASRSEYEAQTFERTTLNDLVDKLNPPPTITDREQYEKALATGRMFREKQSAESKTVGSAYLQDVNGPDAFSKLNRYEVSFERSLFRAIHELQRLQAIRGGTLPPPPGEIDVNVNLPPA